jgi:hypothetical protein
LDLFLKSKDRSLVSLGGSYGKSDQPPVKPVYTSHPSKQTDIKVYLSFLVLYPAQAFSKARIYQIYQQT